MRLSVALAIVFLECTGLTWAGNSRAAAGKMTNIPAQELGAALQTLAKERKFQIIYVWDELQSLKTQGAVGELSSQQALAELLKGTGFTYKYLDENTVTIVPLTSQSPKMDKAQMRQSDAAVYSPSPLTRDVGARRALGGPHRVAQMDQEDSRGGTAGHADANSVPANGEKLQEITVTAQKREEKLQNVPISISVLRGADLDGSTAEGLTEALGRVPGVSTTTTYVGGMTQVSMRGVAAMGFALTGSAPVAYYLDSVPFGFVRSAFAPDANAYDMERVEVLRGPQGTLYGASALNGVVRVLTKDADLNQLEFKARGLGSSTRDGGQNARANMALNVPLIEGKLAARAVLGYEDLSGWIDRPAEKNANDAQLRNLRLKIDGQPTDELSVGLSAWVSRSNFGAPSTSDESGHNGAVLDEPTQTDFDAYGLKLRYDFPEFSLSSMTSYLKFDNQPDIALGTSLLGSQFLSKVYSQEVLVNSRSAGRWRWSAGGMYRHDKDLLFQTIDGATVTNFSDKSESIAIFGELTRLFMDGKLELTGGLRYFEDKVGLEDYSPVGADAGRTFNSASPRFVLTMHPSVGTTLYASYAEGFRSGVFQTPLVVSSAPSVPPADADTLKNYEVGLKRSFLDGRLNVDSAVYYIDWKDLQQGLNILVGSAIYNALVNGGSASGVGADLGVTMQPIDNLQLGLNIDWNDLTMDERVLSGGIELFQEGDRLNASPKYTAGAFISYAFPLGQGYKGRLSTSANYVSKQVSRGEFGGVLVIAESDPLRVGRASLSVDAPEHWGMSLFIDNFNNEQGAGLTPPLGNPSWSSRLRPRTVGLQVDYHF